MRRFRGRIKRLERLMRHVRGRGLEAIAFAEPDGTYLYEGRRVKELPPRCLLIIPDVEGVEDLGVWEAWARDEYSRHRERVEQEFGWMLRDPQPGAGEEDQLVKEVSAGIPKPRRKEEPVFMPGRGWVSMPVPDQAARPPERNWK